MDSGLINGIFTNLHRLSALVVLVVLWRGVASPKVRKLLLGMGLLSLITGAHKFGVGMKDAFAGWHMWAGIKVLLALHVVAMAILIGRGTAPLDKMERWRKGALISSLLTAILGLWIAHFAR